MVLDLRRQTICVILCANRTLKASTITVGACAQRASRATVHTARNQSQWVAAGALRKCARAVKSLAYFGTRSALRATTAKDVVYARKTARTVWVTSVKCVRKRITRGLTRTLWSALLTRSRKDSCATNSAVPVRLAHTTFAGASAQLVKSSAVYCASNREIRALPISLASVRIRSLRLYHSTSR